MIVAKQNSRWCYMLFSAFLTLSTCNLRFYKIAIDWISFCVCSKARTEGSMDDVVDATHDRAQHFAASALTTTGGPPALGSLPDLTGLSTDEVRMLLWFVKHTTTWLSSQLYRTSFTSVKTIWVCLLGCPSKCIYLSLACSTLTTRNTVLLCEAHASSWPYLHRVSSSLFCSW